MQYLICAAGDISDVWRGGFCSCGRNAGAGLTPGPLPHKLCVGICDVHASEVAAEGRIVTVEDGFVMMIGGDGLGRGDAELGRLLMTKFLHELGGQRSLPEKVIFVNHGVKLVVRDSPVLGQIQHLEHTGVEVAACGTCLQRLGQRKTLRLL